MNQDETIKLWNDCQAAKKALFNGNNEDEAHEAAVAVWNAWAQGLDEKNELEKAGAWLFRIGLYGDEGLNHKTKDWLVRAKVNFARITFIVSGNKECSKNVKSVLCEGEVINFTKFLMPWGAIFEGATFSGRSSFFIATFSEYANFKEVTFSNVTNFTSVIFTASSTFTKSIFDEEADFSNATFSDFSDFEKVIFFGDTNFSEATFSSYANFKCVTFSGDTDFSVVTFSGVTDFFGTTFSGTSDFGHATFFGSSGFESITFQSTSNFGGTVFSGYSNFSGVCFSNDSDFRNTTFSDISNFSDSTFLADAIFDYSDFEKEVRFTEVTFTEKASFASIISKRSFSLADTNFVYVPDVTEADFHQPPRLDNIHIGRAGGWWREDRVDQNVSAMYRALKRLAEDAKDHDNEMKFFAGEMRCARYNTDMPFGTNAARYWFGMAYEFFSSFGRSLVKPLFWWGVVVMMFTWFYFSQHKTGQEGCVPISITQKNGKIKTIIDPTNNPFDAALFLSLKRALPLVGYEREKTNQSYVCLFGQNESYASSKKEMIPNIPNIVIKMGILETILATIFLFLFGLAIRNHFRMK